MSKGKLLSLDYGGKRVGVAISDEDKTVAFPRGFLTYSDAEDLLSQIRTLVEGENVTKIILGLPIKMDGSIDTQAVKVQEFGKALQKTLPNVKLEYFDERLTSATAHKLLKGKGISTKGEKGQIDAIAAQLILEGYLSSLQG